LCAERVIPREPNAEPARRRGSIRAARRWELALIAITTAPFPALARCDLLIVGEGLLLPGAPRTA
jgi:hypothetical protein